MKKVDKDLLKTSALNLMFDMSEDQYETLLKEFATIIEQMKLVGNIKDIDEVSPMTFPYTFETSFLREDVSEKPLNRDEALKNAKDVVDGQIRLPKVIG